ncbi:hypothetical protein D918_04090 [Trichuris suis]|uniref:Proteasome activator PA28 C-terminal domain-containing protein n=1 Tax=Trichuris suis TaxID=68888 RepID=A0A085MLC8_9BILA|nr:hypothetical protein M513_01257 [Trichuris suis]KHJ45878.1 hypothetical protein D918_04090 [Trichuris suis]
MDKQDSLESPSKSAENSESDEGDGQYDQDRRKTHPYTENALLTLKDQYLRCANIEFPARIFEIKDVLDKCGRKRHQVYEEVNVPLDDPIPIDTKLTVGEMLNEREGACWRKKSNQQTRSTTLELKFGSLQKQCEYERRKVAVITLSDLSPVYTERVFKGTNIPMANYNGFIGSNNTVKKLHNKLKEETAKAHSDLYRIIIAITIQCQYDTVHRTNNAEYLKGILETLRQRFDILDSNNERIFKYYKKRADVVSKLIRLPYCKDLRVAINWIDWNECKATYLNLRRLQSDYAYFLNLIASITIINSSEMNR